MNCSASIGTRVAPAISYSRFYEQRPGAPPSEVLGHSPSSKGFPYYTRVRGKITAGSPSENELERKLNLPRGPGARDDAGLSRIYRRVWQIEVRMVEDIEKLRTELHPSALGDAERLEY